MSWSWMDCSETAILINAVWRHMSSILLYLQHWRTYSMMPKVHYHLNHSHTAHHPPHKLHCILATNEHLTIVSHSIRRCLSTLKLNIVKYALLCHVNNSCTYQLCWRSGLMSQVVEYFMSSCFSTFSTEKQNSYVQIQIKIALLSIKCT